MGLFDIFKSKKKPKKEVKNSKALNEPSEFEKLVLKTMSIMQFTISEATPADIMAVHSFIFATKERKSNYISFNTTCLFDTVIYSCFKLYIFCYLEIKDKKFAKIFADNFINRYTLAISEHFHLSHQRTSEYIENRFNIYNKAIKQDYDFNDVVFEFKQILLSDVNLFEPRFFEEDMPLVISGFDKGFMCELEIVSYNKLLTSVCNDSVFEVIEYYNNGMAYPDD